MADVILDVFPALVAACEASLDLTGVRVVDGPATKKGSEKARLFVGATDEVGGVVAEGDNIQSSLPGVIDAESFSVSLIAEAWGGSTDLTAIRAKVFAMRRVVAAVIRPTLSNVVLGVPALASAQMGQWTLTPIQDADGAYMRLGFSIEFVARPTTA